MLPSQRQIQLSTSLGLVTWDSMGPRATADDLLRGAGLAVREARRAGRNHIEVCTAELIAVADETLAIGKDLRKALDEKGLRVCYQPLVDLTHGSIVGFEALVRWSHPVHGHVSPARFVPVAEEFGLISELGRMVLSTATAQIQQWSSTFRIPLTAHVNVSGVDLANAGFVAMVEECLDDRAACPATQLVLEVTESAVEPQLETARERFDVAARHRRPGRPRRLRHRPHRRWPTCRRWPSTSSRSTGPTSTPSTRHRADDLLRGVISLGQALGMEVYGEGIEDEAQSAAAAPQRLRHRPGLPVRAAAADRGRRGLPPPAGRAGLRRLPARLSRSVPAGRGDEPPVASAASSALVDIMSLIGALTMAGEGPFVPPGPR